MLKALHMRGESPMVSPERCADRFNEAHRDTDDLGQDKAQISRRHAANHAAQHRRMPLIGQKASRDGGQDSRQIIAETGICMNNCTPALFH